MSCFLLSLTRFPNVKEEKYSIILLHYFENRIKLEMRRKKQYFSCVFRSKTLEKYKIYHLMGRSQTQIPFDLSVFEAQTLSGIGVSKSEFTFLADAVLRVIDVLFTAVVFVLPKVTSQFQPCAANRLALYRESYLQPKFPD